MCKLKNILKPKNILLCEKEFKKIYKSSIKKEHYININQYMSLLKKNENKNN